MSLDFSQLPIPEERTPQDWVNFYSKIEDAVAQGQTVKFGETTWTMDNLAEIRKARREWERRVIDKARSSRKSAGGIRYSTPDMS